MDHTTNGVIQSIKHSDQQVCIFDWFRVGKGNLVVTARAGTGKTYTILEAINHAPERDILLAAFNKSIAEELKTKLRNPSATAKTLHSIGYGIILRNWTVAKLDDGRGHRIASVVAAGAPDAVVSLIQKVASKGKGMFPFPKKEDLVDICYTYDHVPDENMEEQGWTVERIAECAMRAMDMAATVKDGTVDFDDMVFVPVRNKWARGRYGLVVIDEAQDMNASQLLLAMGVRRPGGRIVVVGDDRQAIYGFRGADSNSIQRLRTELKATELKLTVTYRCPKKVVEYAQKLVPDYLAAPSAPEGEITSVDFEKLHEVAKPGDFVLSRKNAPLAKVCLRLLRNGTRAKIEGLEIGKGLVSLLDKMKAKSIPDLMERLTKWEEKQTERLKATKKKSAETRIEFVKDQVATLQALAEGMAGLKELRTRVQELFTEGFADKSTYVLCSSVHRAKGREAPVVFVLNETLYPGGRADIEEQNLDYVAATRAKSRLTWVSGIC